MNVLWLRPSKGDNISVRRERIAEELRERGYSIDICDATGIDALGAIKQAVAGDYDVIAGNVRIGLYLGFPLARLLRTPFLGDVSDPVSDIDDLPGPLFRFFEWYEWQALKRADAAVFVYESTYQEALERGIDDAVKLPNAVNYELFAEPDEEAVQGARETLEREGMDFEKPIAMYLGVLTSHYCIEEILDAAEVASDWVFVFIGEGPLEAEVQQRASELDNVYYPGAFEYRLMPGFLAHADVGFCFKDAEQPLKLKEYGAAGLPIIARPGELSKWYGQDDLAFVEAEPGAVADMLEKLQQDKAMSEVYAEAGREIAGEWSWAEIADGYNKIFKNIYR